MRIVGTLCSLALLVTGCAGNYAQTDALTRVTNASCDWYDMCGRIGEGKDFPSRTDCEANLHSKWNAEWPTAACNGRIRVEDLDICVASMQNTECASDLDLVSAVKSKCGSAAVCQGSTQ